MGFKKIFFGMVFLFDFRIQSIDILPDFIGFIFIFLGLSELCHIHQKFNMAKTLSLILIFISIPDVYDLTITNPLVFLFSLGYTILFLFFIYYLFTGIRDIAIEIGNMILANRANITWVLALAYSLSFYLVIFIPFLIFIYFIFGIAVFVLELTTIHLAGSTII